MPLRIGVVIGGTDPVMWALEKTDVLKEAGIAPTFTTFNAGVNMLPAFVHGDLDVGLMAATPMISLNQQGVNVQAIAVATPGGAFGVLAHPNSGITSLCDLRGKKVGMIAGSIQELVLTVALKPCGMTLADITEVNLSVAVTPAAYANNSVDAVFAAVVAYLRVRAEGATELLSANQVANTPGTRLGLTNFWAAANVSKNMVAMTRFIKAISLAQHWVAANPSSAEKLLETEDAITPAEAALDLSISGSPSISQQASASYALNIVHGGFASNLQPIVDFMVQHRQIPTAVAVANLVNPAPMKGFVASR